MIFAGDQKEPAPWLPRALFLLLIVVACAVSAFERNSVWRDPVSLWEDAAQKSPRIGRIYNNLGEAYHRKKQLAKALENYYKAISVSPGSSLDAYGNIGSIYVDLGEYGKAVKIFSQMLTIDQNDAGAYASRGHAYYRDGSYDNAIQDFNTALLLFPRNAMVYLLRGNCHEKKGNRQAAMQDLRSACALGEAGACDRLMTY